MQTRMKKSLVFGIICVLILVSIPTLNAEVDYFQNSMVLIFGKCNTTSCGSIWWKFGLYIPVIKRNFFMIASDENESINVLILSFKDGFGYLMCVTVCQFVNCLFRGLGSIKLGFVSEEELESGEEIQL